MADLQKLERALVNADAAGDVEAARILAGEVQKLRGSQESLTDRIGGTVKEFVRQVGLTARHGVEGTGQILDLGGAPIATTLNAAFPSQRFDLPSQSAKKVADFMGLPTPQNKTERVVGEAVKFGAGSAFGVGLAQQGAKLPGMVGEVSKQLAMQPGSQIAAGGGAGTAGKTAQETGQSPGWQLAASLAGGVAGGLAPQMAGQAVKSAQSLLPSTRREVDAQISRILADSGVDYTKIPTIVRDGLRADVSKAMNIGGDLDAEAVRRLADIRLVGGTPTRGMVTLDPVQITKEQNLAKIAANSQDDALSGLPLLYNKNNEALIRFANKKAGGDADLYSAGERAIGTIRTRDEAARTIERQLYKRAEESAGRSIELSRTDFVNKAFENLAKSNKGAFLPDSVEKMLNEISVGQTSKLGKTFDVPFNVDTIDVLKTTLSQEMRSSSNGNVKAAIRAVYDALEQAPIAPIKREFGGSGVVTGQGAQYLQAADSLPEEALKAFNKARQFARTRRQWHESSRGVNAAIDGAEPDKFVEQFVLKGSVADAAGVMKELRKNPQALEVTKQSIVNHLKQKSLSNADDEIGKFSQAAYNRALKMIGDRKLAMIFDEKEIMELRALGRSASYMQAQPTGSAVNNSNSGALALGRGGDALEGTLKLLPFIGGPLADLSKKGRVAISTWDAKNVPQGLLQPANTPTMPSKMVVPSAMFGSGLLFAPGLDRPEDRKRP